jgi:hypothetical protein
MIAESVARWTLQVILVIITIYGVRHYWFVLSRLFGRQRHPYLDVYSATWPTVTVLVPAHNEEAVIRDSLLALMQSDYPENRVIVIPVNDRSSDGTAAIIDEVAAQFPGRIQPLHRTGGTPGKAAALLEATALIDSEIIVVFDADYVPGPGLIKRLVAPFFDPEVGAVMGRVVPLNAATNLLTRLLDLERTAGYQVDQQARMNLGLVPQYGGTVGGLRRSALREVGGWHEDTLTEDTDVTVRLLLHGWSIVYENRAECYEEVPEAWPVRIRQIKRWACGHNEAARRYAWQLASAGRLVPLRQRLDGLLMLGVYYLAPVMSLGWILTLYLVYAGQPLAGVAAGILAVASYSTLGNFAVFFEVAAAAHLDGSTRRIRLLPLLLASYIVSLAAITRAALSVAFHRRGPKIWDKTHRYRVNAAVRS